MCVQRAVPLVVVVNGSTIIFFVGHIDPSRREVRRGGDDAGPNASFQAIFAVCLTQSRAHVLFSFQSQREIVQGSRVMGLMV